MGMKICFESLMFKSPFQDVPCASLQMGHWHSFKGRDTQFVGSLPCSYHMSTYTSQVAMVSIISLWSDGYHCHQFVYAANSFRQSSQPNSPISSFYHDQQQHLEFESANQHFISQQHNWSLGIAPLLEGVWSLPRGWRRRVMLERRMRSMRRMEQTVKVSQTPIPSDL